MFKLFHNISYIFFHFHMDNYHFGLGEPYKAGEPLYGYQACQVSNAYIDCDILMVPEGKAEVVYRYIDRSILGFSSITYEGTGNVLLTHKVNEKGELTICIETDHQIEIKNFTIEI